MELSKLLLLLLYPFFLCKVLAAKKKPRGRVASEELLCSITLTIYSAPFHAPLRIRSIYLLSCLSFWLQLSYLRLHRSNNSQCCSSQWDNCTAVAILCTTTTIPITKHNERSWRMLIIDKTYFLLHTTIYYYHHYLLLLLLYLLLFFCLYIHNIMIIMTLGSTNCLLQCCLKQ